MAGQPVQTDGSLTRDQAGNLTAGAIEDVRYETARYVACLDAWYSPPQRADVVAAKQRVASDRARAEIMYLQAAADVQQWADLGHRPDLASWAFTIDTLRDIAAGYASALATMAYGWYPGRGR